MANLLKLGIQIGASLSSSFKSALTTANTTLGKVADNAKRMAETKFNTKEFTKLSRAAAENKARIDQQTSSFFAAGSAVRKFNRDSQELGKTYQKLKPQLNLKPQLKDNEKSLADTHMSLVKTAALAYGAYRTARKVIGAADDVAKAQGGIASLGMSAAGVQATTRAAMEFTNTWAGVTTPEFIAASYDIKSGISSLGDSAVGDFTTIAALTAIATKSTIGEMTNLFAKGYGIYRKQFDSFGKSVITGWDNLSAEERDLEFGKYFSAGLASAVQQYRTTGAEMSAALSNLGASATAAGISMADQFAVLGLLQETMGGAEAATKFTAFLRSAGKAQKELGLDVIDEQTGKLKSVPEILDVIADRYGDLSREEDKIELQGLFGDEGIKFVQQLLDSRTRLQSGSAKIQKSLSGGLGLGEEMALAMQTGQGFTLLSQRAGNLSATFGSALSPAAALVSRGLGQTAVGVQWLIGKYPKLTGGIFGVVGGLVGALTAVLALRKGLLVLTNTTNVAAAKTVIFGTVQKAWAIGSTIVTAATTAITAGFRAMSLAVMSNPIGLAIAGIAIAAVLVIKYWKPISAFFVKLWDGIKKIFFSAVEWLTKIWENSPLGLLFKVGRGVASLGKSLFGTGNVGSRNPAVALPGGGSMPLASIQPASRSSVNATSITAPITINAQPGQDGRAIAEEVQRELRKRESQAAARSRGALHD